ncbi:MULTISPECIES: DUF934 domain-containing protein [Aurantimonas]|uniref:DUF934 domain-containing protein n=1 Tax=Aurantimonas coralicida TaxID=182270 RepID=A0A0P0YY45_9HYPH|nr:DUF934 domain-containing protein [Aurantimonas coralicida]BAT26509.1 hypothetical protein [Aurantimonas coralicida]
MTLIRETGETSDHYRRVDSIEALGTDGALIVPLALAEAAKDHLAGRRFGLSVPNNAAVEDIAPLLADVDLVVVEFPAFSDGRGFSLAKRLRRAGFEGTLRASGPLIADQFADALACGFDEVELPETMANRQPVQQWMEAKDTMSRHYQNGYGDDRSILRKRLAAREA